MICSLSTNPSRIEELAYRLLKSGLKKAASENPSSALEVLSKTHFEQLNAAIKEVAALCTQGTVADDTLAQIYALCSGSLPNTTVAAVFDRKQWRLSETIYEIQLEQCIDFCMHILKSIDPGCFSDSTTQASGSTQTAGAATEQERAGGDGAGGEEEEEEDVDVPSDDDDDSNEDLDDSDSDSVSDKDDKDDKASSDEEDQSSDDDDDDDDEDSGEGSGGSSEEGEEEEEEEDEKQEEAGPSPSKKAKISK